MDKLAFSQFIRDPLPTLTAARQPGQQVQVIDDAGRVVLVLGVSIPGPLQLEFAHAVDEVYADEARALQSPQPRDSWLD